MIEGGRKEITEVIKKALQLEPDEKAIVIIDDNKNKRTIDTINVSIGNVLVTLAMALAETMYLCSISRNISEEARLSYLELLLSFIKDEYEAHYSKGTKLES
jgi:hypothetical protein